MREYDLRQWSMVEPELVRDVVEIIDKYGHGTVFVTDDHGILQAAVTDGDVRRGLLAGYGLDSPASCVFNTDFFALVEGVGSDLMDSARANPGVREIPVLDSDGRLVCVQFRPHIGGPASRENTVVIMVGGKGSRLRPLTNEVPKPLLPVAGKPMLQHIIENLRGEGFSDIVLAINYLGEQIENYFQNGSAFGVNIRYVKEDDALGTAGALSLLRQPFSSPIVVMNGDIVLAASVGKMVDYHLEKQAKITIGAKVFETTIPFGVLSMEGLVVRTIEEKPTHRDFVNAGVYVLDARVLESLPTNRVTDMPDLIMQNVRDGGVVAFPMYENWADLGRPEDLMRANEAANGV